MDAQNIKQTTEDISGSLVITDHKIVPITIPEPVRKPKETKNKKFQKNGKPTKKGKKSKEAKTQSKMSKEEMLQYFTGLRNDPNFGILPFPIFVEQTDPQTYAGVSKEQYDERLKRLGFLDAIENAETEEEREAIKAKRAEELKNQVVPHYQTLPVIQNTNPYRG